MTDREVCRYLELVDRRAFIVMNSGVGWRPEYAAEMEAIDKELTGLRRLVDQEHGRREGTQVKEYKVRFWHMDEDGREDFMEADTMEQARELYDSFGGLADIQQWDEAQQRYIDVLWPTFEF